MTRVRRLTSVCLSLSVCLSRTSGLIREQRGLGRLKLAQRQATSHVTRTSLSRSKDQKSTCRGRILWQPPAQLVIVTTFISLKRVEEHQRICTYHATKSPNVREMLLLLQHVSVTSLCSQCSGYGYDSTAVRLLNYQRSRQPQNASLFIYLDRSVAARTQVGLRS